VKPLSLRPALALIYAAVLSVVLAAEGFASHTALSRQLDASTTTDLEEMARGLHGYLRFDSGTPVVTYDESDAEEAAFVADATRYYQVYAADGTLLAQSPGMESLGLRYTPTEVAEFGAAPGIRDLQTDVSGSSRPWSRRCPGIATSCRLASCSTGSTPRCVISIGYWSCEP
jgi:hypothetical protein